MSLGTLGVEEVRYFGSTAGYVTVNGSFAPGAVTSNSQDGTSAWRPSTKCEASPNTAFSTVTASCSGAPLADDPQGCSCRSFSGTGLAQPPMPIRWSLFGRVSISSSAFLALTTG